LSGEHLDVVGVVLARSAPADDPGRQHLERCAQCRILLRTYEQFTAADHVDEQAERRLQAFVNNTVEAHRTRVGEARNVVGDPARPPARQWLAPARGFRGRALPVVFAVAMAAAAVVCFVRLRSAESPDVLLRQGPSAGGSGAQEVTLDAPRATSGGPDLRWRPVGSADAYAVRIYGPDLRLLASLSPQPTTSLRLDRSIPALSAVPESLFARVVALRDSVAIGQSVLRAVVLPR
jgi:hypothetical protein